MTEGNGHIIDPTNQARLALQAAVAEYGPQVLSNPVILDGICRERLPGLPGEFILVGSAARSDVPALLRERTATASIDDAIRSVAATVAAAHGLDTAACVWVVTEFARALGYRMPGRIPSPADTIPIGSTDQGEPLPSGWTAPEGGPPRRRGPNRSVLGLAAAGALVVVYLAVAAGAHLIPFSGTPASLSSPPPVIGGSSANGTPDVAADASPDVAPDPAPDPDPDPDPGATLNSTLLSLIPSNIQSGNACSDNGTPLGATAAILCADVQGPAGTFYYYLFATTSALNQGYDNFLNTSFQNSCTASDGNFEKFIPRCQSSYSNSSSSISGTVSEYLNNDNNPVIASTEDQQLVMCVTVGTDGSNLLAFWNRLQWIATGG